MKAMKQLKGTIIRIIIALAIATLIVLYVLPSIGNGVSSFGEWWSSWLSWWYVVALILIGLSIWYFFFRKKPVVKEKEKNKEGEPEKHHGSTDSSSSDWNNFLKVCGIALLLFIGWKWYNRNIYAIDSGETLEYSVSSNMEWSFVAIDGEIDLLCPDKRVFRLKEDRLDRLIKESSDFRANSLNQGDQRSTRGMPSGVYEFFPVNGGAKVKIKISYI